MAIYKVQKRMIILVEAELTADSKADAKRLLDEGYGDFYDSDGSYDASYKVLYEMESSEYEETE
tara:strand:+ start:122 stop:313 length:192 start_codon:yes stop_codon:yes gene_type:complete